MPATPTRIGFVLEQWRRVRAETPAVQTNYGSLARESEDPLETFFDDPDDAEVMATARQALLGANRRRFDVAAVGLDAALGVSYVAGTIPLADMVDAEKAADISHCLIGEIGYSFARQRSLFQVWG